MNELKRIEKLAFQGMSKYKYIIYNELKSITKAPEKKLHDTEKNKKILLKRAKNSLKEKNSRFRNRPQNIMFNPDLPIVREKDRIIDTIKKNRVVIISGDTGSGKTTQIPKFCLEAGQGVKGLIGCTQPRRIAAVSVARRIAHELKGKTAQAVGYKIRFDSNISEQAYIKIMTDGILLAETQKDKLLKEYDTIVVDEAHERSLNIDFTLGFLKKLIKRRKDLKLIITSATIDTEKFSKAFENAPVIEISGRMYPIRTIYMPLSDKERQDTEDYVEATAEAVDYLMSGCSSGDILVFMPSEQDIGETIELIKGRNHPGVSILPLFARLPAREQSKIFSKCAERKIIVSTNVAETSLTIPGIKYVVDTGLARIPSYSPRTRTTALPVSLISKSSANQRKGRCGRIQNGVCIRLFHEDDFEKRPLFTSPEILRSNLAEVILRMIFLNLGDLKTFPFIDPPAPKSIKDGFDTLIEIEAIKEKTSAKKKEYTLTETGRIMAQMPIDPKLSRILIESEKKGCLREAAIIVSALAIGDPRHRPVEKSQAADQRHSYFKNPNSDFLTLLNIWKEFKRTEKKLKYRSEVKRYCQDNFLSFKRLREWSDVQRQIINILKEHNLKGKKRISPESMKKSDKEDPLYIALHKSILCGYIGNIARKKEKNVFNAAKGKQIMIFPGSGLFDKSGTWIVAAEFIKTSQLFARTVANIDPGWLQETGRDLCTYTYSDPHWEKKRGEVVARQQTSLFGLVITNEKKTGYGRINPEEAGEIFIRHALVQGEIPKKFPFMEHNEKLISELKISEKKTRKRNILASEDDIYLFYRSKLLKPFYNLKTFSKFIKDNKDKSFLKMEIKDLQKFQIDEKELALFPDTIRMEHGQFDLEYEFDPGSKKDGVTIKIPASSAALVSKNGIDSLVPGLFEEKIGALMKNLPKKYRVMLLPLQEKAEIIARQMPLKEGSLFSRISSFIKKKFNIVIPPSVWSDSNLEDYLKMRISIRNEKGKEIKSFRDKSILNRFSENLKPLKDTAFDRARQKYEKTCIREWDFGDLEDFILIEEKKVYQRLKVERDTLSLRLFKSRQEAFNSHVKGIKKLFSICFKDDFRALKKDIMSSQGLKRISPLFNGKAEFQKTLFNCITDTCFALDIRTKEAFNKHKAAVIPGLYDNGREFIKNILKLGEEYKKTFDLLRKLSFRYQNRTKTLQFLSGLLRDHKNLIPPNFPDIYEYGRIKDLHRYVICTRIRAQRALDNPAGEKRKAALLDEYINHLNGLLKSLSPDSSPEKTQAVEEFFWLLEEYKISLFAQELRTNTKLSAGKLDSLLSKISSMV